MNFIFISPNFPHTYWNFCDRLKRNGVNVLGIGDAPYDSLEEPLKAALTEYYKVGNYPSKDEKIEEYAQALRLCKRCMLISVVLTIIFVSFAILYTF